MNWRLALVTLGAIPVMCLVFWGLTRALPPLLGYGAAFCVYWLLIGLAVLRHVPPDDRARLTTWQPPGRILATCGLVPVVLVAWIALERLEVTAMPAAMLFVIAIVALVNGTLEELFWRGALLPAPDREGAAVSLGLFTLWYLAPACALGITLTGGPAALILGALVLGTVWTAMRRRTGTLGASIASHVGVNIFAFTDLAARNWPHLPVG
jgi:membrane protease YdiL (CAAX protease family)